MNQTILIIDLQAPYFAPSPANTGNIFQSIDTSGAKP
jgi:hypothetical protein